MVVGGFSPTCSINLIESILREDEVWSVQQHKTDIFNMCAAKETCHRISRDQPLQRKCFAAALTLSAASCHEIVGRVMLSLPDA